MLLFGRRYSWLHKWIDEPWKTLGKKHRRIRHDYVQTPFEAFIISGGDVKALMAAYGHIMLDNGLLNPELIEAAHLIRCLRKNKP
ncbi:MAG: hypothetical protein QXF53_02545 [Candidatus Bathyarchaeia archaeon]